MSKYYVLTNGRDCLFAADLALRLWKRGAVEDSGSLTQLGNLCHLLTVRALSVQEYTQLRGRAEKLIWQLDKGYSFLNAGDLTHDLRVLLDLVRERN